MGDPSFAKSFRAIIVAGVYAAAAVLYAMNYVLIMPGLYSLVYLNPVSLRMLPTLGTEEGYYVHLLLALFLLLADTIFSAARAPSLWISCATSPH